MKALREFFRPSQPQEQQAKGLDRICSLGENLESVLPSTVQPAHVIAHGTIQVGKQPIQDIKTAVRIRGENAEFSTNTCQLPNTPLGKAIPESLNHRLPGKFVTFEAEQQNMKDLVYVTASHAASLNRASFNQELEHHAKVQVVARNVSAALPSYGQPVPQLTDQGIQNLAQEIVDGNLNLRRKLESKFVPSQYLPTNQSKG
jgi:hypothetical protein